LLRPHTQSDHFLRTAAYTDNEVENFRLIESEGRICINVIMEVSYFGIVKLSITTQPRKLAVENHIYSENIGLSK